jgi:Na+/phosphate symporter
MSVALVKLAGDALLLYGISVMSDALKELAGDQARAKLRRATDGAWRGSVLGAGAVARRHL